MAIAPFLAMTAAEIRANPVFFHPLGWMACHFSPYGTGLSNLPQHLPPGSLLILNDRTPWLHHDPQRIADHLEELLHSLSCWGLLLDFQRPDVPEVTQLTTLLCSRLSCPVGVTEAYCADLPCPVFLPPVPLQQTVEEYLTPWQGRKIWLDLALSCEKITVAESGCSSAPLLPWECPEDGHTDHALQLHYQTAVSRDQADFILWRTGEDLYELLQEAESYGVTTAVGLWQELKA